jgi:hypothetical protein
MNADAMAYRAFFITLVKAEFGFIDRRKEIGDIQEIGHAAS